MKTSFFNGINTGKLDFDYNVRYRPRTDVSPLGMKRQIHYLFKDIKYEHICYVWENDKYSKHKHSHSLVKTDDNNIIQQLQKNIISLKEPIIEERKIPIQRERCLINPKNGEKIHFKQDIWENVTSTKIIGKHGELYIEPVLSNVSSSIYTHKYTDYGSNFGFITPTLIY